MGQRTRERKRNGRMEGERRQTREIGKKSWRWSETVGGRRGRRLRRQEICHGKAEQGIWNDEGIPGLERITRDVTVDHMRSNLESGFREICVGLNAQTLTVVDQ